MTYSDGLSQYALGLPTIPITMRDDVSRDSGDVRPFRDGKASSFMGQADVGSFVVALFDARGPSAVVRRIGTIVINAVETVSGRAWPHILRERFEAPCPSFANGDAATAVAGPGMIARIETAGLHRPPHVVSFGFGLSVSFESLGSEFPLSTPAALREMPTQIHSKHLSGIAAQASAYPSRTSSKSLSSLRSPHDGQASKRLSGQVDSRGLHGRNYTTNAHTYTPGVTT